MSSPKEFHMDAVYPEPLSRLRRGHGLPNSCNESSTSSPSYRRAVRKQMRKGTSGTGGGVSGRYRTQPVTFHEIQEVDEENLAETEPDKPSSVGAASRSESDLKAKFEIFYRSIEAPAGGNHHDKNPYQKKLCLSNEPATNSPVAISSEENANRQSFIPSTSSTLSTTPGVPIKKSLMSRDDSSATTTNVGSQASSFNPKSRPSL